MGTTLASFAKLLVGALGEVVFLAQHSSNPTCNNKAESPDEQICYKLELWHIQIPWLAPSSQGVFTGFDTQY